MGIFAHGKYQKKQNDTFLVLTSDSDLLEVEYNDMNYLIGERRARVIWKSHNNAGEPIYFYFFASIESSNILPIIRNTFFSSDMEYLALYFTSNWWYKSHKLSPLQTWFCYGDPKRNPLGWVPTVEKYLGHLVSQKMHPFNMTTLILKVMVQLHKNDELKKWTNLIKPPMCMYQHFQNN